MDVVNYSKVMSIVYFSTLPDAEKRRYKLKVESFSKEEFSNAVDPYEMDGWIDDLSLWPLVSGPAPSLKGRVPRLFGRQ